MVNIKSFKFIFLIACIIGLSAAAGNSTQLPPGAVDPGITPDDILNAPVVAVPLVDPSFEPINGGSNATIIKIIPTFASVAQNLPSITASLASELATSTPTGTPKARRDLNKRKNPPDAIDFKKINCNFEFNPKYTSWRLWQAAISSACQTWFPIVENTYYLIEGSSQGPQPIPPSGSTQFHFSYHVRSNPFQGFTNYHPITTGRCIAELTARTYAALNPDSNGVAQATGICLGDWSGFDSGFDENASIWYSLESPK